MNFKSVSDLNNDIKKWIFRLPKDFDLIVGIPRSGLFAASMMALHMNLPFTDLDGFCERRVFGAGKRYGKSRPDIFYAKKALILDDSLLSGRQMREVKSRIAVSGIPNKVSYAAVYSSAGNSELLDFFYEKLGTPRCFEWNIMNHPLLSGSCVDIDGVLCRDPTSEENDDGNKYLDFIRNVEPAFNLEHELGWLVTCRLEKYRSMTEEWLNRNGIRYSKLVMMNFPDKASRIASGSHASFKARVYRESGFSLFVESSFSQATEIQRLSQKPVYCFESGLMLNSSKNVPGMPGLPRRVYRKAKRLLGYFNLSHK